MRELWDGSVALGPGWLAFRGKFGTTHAHAHAAVQIVVVTTGTVRLIDGHGESRSARTAVIPARAPHAIHAPAAQGVSVYCDPDSSVGRAVQSRFAAGPGDRVADWVSAAGPLAVLREEAAVGRMAQALRALAETPDAAVPHPAVRRAIGWVQSHLGGPVRLEDAAAAVRISSSRLGHLFAQDLGMSYPVYLRWARLRCAIELVRAGSTLTEAAHGAGFCDSSHFTRVVHEMFGLAPSELVRGVRWARQPTAGAAN